MKIKKIVSGAEYIFVAFLGGAPRDLEGAPIHLAPLLAGYSQAPA